MIKKMFVKSKKYRLLIIGSITLAPIIIFALNTVDTGYRSDPGTTITIDAHGTCKQVINSSSNSYFVPTKTAAEWAAFRANLPSGVSLGECCTSNELGYCFDEIDNDCNGSVDFDDPGCPCSCHSDGSCKIVFLSSSDYTGNLGGLAGADAICQALADNAHLSGTYKAWLSTDSAAARDRLTHSNVPYVRIERTDCTTVANNWNDLIDGSLINAISTEINGFERSRPVWTGTREDGSIAPAYGTFKSSGDCVGWTSDGSMTPTVWGRGGHAWYTNSRWTNWDDYSAMACWSPRALYCFQQ